MVDHRADLHLYVDGQRVLTITPDGAITVAGQFYEAAEAFWDVLAKTARRHGVELGRSDG